MSRVIQDILNERGKTHGDFSTNSYISQSLKEVMHNALGYHNLHSSQMEALDMIAHKIGRILAGNPMEVGHWRDICGYSQLIVNILESNFPQSKIVPAITIPAKLENSDES